MLKRKKKKEIFKKNQQNGFIIEKIKRFLYIYRYDIVVLLFLLFSGISLCLIDLKGKLPFLENREEFQALVLSFGVWGPLFTVLVIVAEVVFAPLPGFVPAISAGFVFGYFWGTLYTYLGNIIGTIVVFFIARRVGRSLVERIFEKDRLEKYEKAIKRHENWILLFYFFPLLPLDILTAAMGLSAISWEKFFGVISFGYLFYSIFLNIFGSYLAELFF